MGVSGELVLLVILAVLPAQLALFGLSDTSISTADTSIRDNEATTSVSKASNSSAGVKL